MILVFGFGNWLSYINRIFCRIMQPRQRRHCKSPLKKNVRHRPARQSKEEYELMDSTWGEEENACGTYWVLLSKQPAIRVAGSTL